MANKKQSMVKLGKHKIKIYEDLPIEEYAKLANSKGLTSDSILYIVSQIESNEVHDHAEKFKLMKCLIPEKSIPEEAFIRMTCLLCNPEFDMDLKLEILKWMNTVYSFVEDLSNFEDFIELFLALIHNDTLRPYVCHLLVKITRKELLTLDRFTSLCNLFKKKIHIDDSSLMNLLLSYSTQCSDVGITSLQDEKVDFDARGIYPSLIKNVHPSFDASNYVDYILSDNKHEPIPAFCIGFEKCTQLSPKISDVNEKSLMTLLDEENGFLTLYKELQSLEKEKIKNILKHKYRRLYLTSCVSEKKKTSIEDFILVSMYLNAKNMDFLRDILEIFHEMEKSIPDLSDCIHTIIEAWDGSTGLDVILGFLSYEPLCCFEKFQYKLELIQEKLLNSSVFVKYDLIRGLSNLYAKWVFREYKQNDRSCRVKCTCSALFDFSTSLEEPSLIKEIDKLGNYIALICDAFLLDNNFHIGLTYETLLHNEKVSRCHVLVHGLVMHPLSTIAFLTSVFSRNSIILESFCRLMNRYSEEIKHMNADKHHEASQASLYFKTFKKDFNLLLLNDGKSFNLSTHFCKENFIPRLRKVYPDFEKYFEVYRHPALIEEVASFVHNSGICLPEIKYIGKFNADFLKYLKEIGLVNFVGFLHVVSRNKK